LYDTLEDFYLAEALEYINTWKKSTPDNPVGICGPIGPTEQLPLVARLVNELGINIRSAHFWGMDEWLMGEREASITHPLSLTCRPRTASTDSSRPRDAGRDLHFPKADTMEYRIVEGVRCAVMQGGHARSSIGPLTTRRDGRRYLNNPPTARSIGNCTPGG
jgi:glucosamine-6-phosphate deaminase